MLFFVLLKPKIIGFRNKLFRSAGKHRKRVIVLGILGACFLGVLFVVSCRILLSFQSVEMIGDFLARKLLSMVLLTLFSLLIFSQIISGLGNLYLSNDLDFCHAAPVSIRELFAARAVHTLLDSSWMLLVFGLPVFMTISVLFVAAVILLEAGPVYWLFSAPVGGKEVPMFTWVLVALSFFLALALSLFVTYRSMETGCRALEDYE